MQSIGWIRDGNVTPLLKFAATLVRYDLSDEELLAYEADLATSDAESEQWVHVRMPPSNVELRLAGDVGTSVVYVQIAAPDAITNQLQGVAAFLAIFLATNPNE